MSMSIDYGRVQAVFLAAVEAKDPAERAQIVNAQCAGDDELRSRVEALLRAHDQSGELPEVGTLDFAGERQATVVGPTTSTAGKIIADRYRLLEEIGEGGMGTVWVAEQLQPVRRRVAIKLIKPGMDSRQVLSRFEAERQALAVMDHPNIAKVLDGGVTDQGSPFFVMEYVKGVPLTQFCDEARISVAGRLGLFVQVCQAVQHAHQKGIVHRDLKPSNILVCLYDGHPVPKVIDFGLAKAINQPLTENTLYTAHGVMVGTPLYMSPEQAEFNNLDVDTRTDIYSLGVILYELLTGTTPLDRQRFKEAAWQEIVRLIKEEEPSKPSTKLSGSGSLPSVAAQRSLEPAQLTRLVRGDLDWIVMKALEKERSRRYETANGLARDLQRYLADEAVEARPTSTTYRLRKFFRRNKGLVRAVAAVFLLLVAGIVGTSWGMLRAERARQEAEDARNAEAAQRQRAVEAAAAEKEAKETAQDREAETRAVLDFVEKKVFGAARTEAEGGLGPEITLRRAIEAAVRFVDQGFDKQPLIAARLRMALGTSFYFLGDGNAAADQYGKARTIYTSQLGPDHLYTLRSIDNLANAYASQGRQSEALKLREEVLTREKAVFGPDNPETLGAMNNLGASYSSLGRYADALNILQETLALSKTKLGPNDPETLRTSYNLARALAGLGRNAEAVKLHEETLARRRVIIGPDHPDTFWSMTNLADGYAKLGRKADALKLQEETLALQKAKLGPSHPDTLASMNNLAMSYAGAGRRQEAAKLFEDAFVLLKAKKGANHPHTLQVMYNVACINVLMIPDVSDHAKQAILAVTLLQQAVDAGFQDVELIKKDRDLDALRDRPDFKKLLDRLQAKASAGKK
jgi:serine/threonine protein kinase/tetratricopeptide (TPR) repeat protein